MFSSALIRPTILRYFRLALVAARVKSLLPEPCYAIFVQTSCVMSKYSSDEAADALAGTSVKILQRNFESDCRLDEVVRWYSPLFLPGPFRLIGVPGLAKHCFWFKRSHVRSIQFKRIQFTPDLMSDIIGAETMDKERNFKFIKGPVFANIVLADEINRTPPRKPRSHCWSRCRSMS